MSKLSVIIPVYNEENTILNIVNKVKNCGVPELEIIIVDDCSTDYAFTFSRGSSQPRDQTQVSCISGGLFTS